METGGFHCFGCGSGRESYPEPDLGTYRLILLSLDSPLCLPTPCALPPPPADASHQWIILL